MTISLKGIKYLLDWQKLHIQRMLQENEFLIKELEEQLRAAEQCVHLPIGGEQVDGQEKVENDRPKAAYCTIHGGYKSEYSFEFCPYCGERLSSSTSKQDETDTAPHSDGR